MLKCNFFKFPFEEQIVPTIYIYLERYQNQLVAKVKVEEDPVVLAGDGRHDSMGHSAKYCAYTVFSCSLPRIIHFKLVQVCKHIIIPVLYHEYLICSKLGPY